MAGQPDPKLSPPGDGKDAVEWLLFGSEYHKVAKYRWDKSPRGSSVDPASLPTLPEPLALSKNKHFVECLRTAFRHVASLGFVEMPDYKLIGRCLRGFLRDASPAYAVPSIDWKERPSASKRRLVPTSGTCLLDTGGVAYALMDEDTIDPLDDAVLAEAESDRLAALEAVALEATKGDDGASGPSFPAAEALAGEAADLERLPLALRFRLAQAEYNARRPDTIPQHLALRDWMALAVPLAHGVWDTAAWERGNHRREDDGYRCEVYMSLLQKCLAAAEPFGGFTDRECYYHPRRKGEEKRKRRRVGTNVVPPLVADNAEAANESPLVVVSRVFFLLRLALDIQRGKNFAPPPKLSFGNY